MTENLTLDEVRAMALRAGLTRLTDDHLQQLLRATQKAQQWRRALPTANLTPADEPSHLFRLSGDEEL